MRSRRLQYVMDGVSLYQCWCHRRRIAPVDSASAHCAGVVRGQYGSRLLAEGGKLGKGAEDPRKTAALNAVKPTTDLQHDKAMNYQLHRVHPNHETCSLNA